MKKLIVAIIFLFLPACAAVHYSTLPKSDPLPIDGEWESAGRVYTSGEVVDKLAYDFTLIIREGIVYTEKTNHPILSPGDSWYKDVKRSGPNEYVAKPAYPFGADIINIKLFSKDLIHINNHPANPWSDVYRRKSLDNPALFFAEHYPEAAPVVATAIPSSSSQLQPVNMFFSDERHALVIGNGSYATSPLPNPTRDANAVSASLRRLGFTVIHKNNVSLQDMERAMDQFYASLGKGSVGLFYYAGHGVQVDGRNYLVPTDASINSESDIKYECMDAGRILGKMEDAKNTINIVILDACRNNPFAGSYRSASRGLARMDAPTGSIVAYSTAPGKVASDGTGKNGVYTKHLLQHMATPGLNINDIFIRTRMGVIQETSGQQVPWESSSLTGYFYFAGQQNEIKNTD